MSNIRQTVIAFCDYSLKMYSLTESLKNGNALEPKLGYDRGRSAFTERPERAHRLEETEKDRLAALLGTTDIPDFILHYGGQNQETLRASGASALTMGNDVYIREEAYNESTVFTDAVLLHEMAHIIQRKEGKRLTAKEDVEAAEREAEEAERLAYPHEDGYYYVEIDGELFYMNKERERKAVNYAAARARELIEKAIEREDISLLCAAAREIERGARYD